MIEGQYTKASAVYTDELAFNLLWRLAFQKVSGERRLVRHTIGQKTLDLSLSLSMICWSPLTWKAPAHINIHESASVLRLLKRQAITSPKKGLAVGVDSHVGLSALAKGRSPSYGLRPVMRRAACCCPAGCLYPSYLFAPARRNPADCLTRNVDFPHPVPSSICGSCCFDSLLALAPASGLRRFCQIGLV